MPTATEPTVVTLADALQAIRQLRLELAELRDQLASEVRTRRLVVVDEAGRAVIHTQVLPDATVLTVRWLPADADTTHAAVIDPDGSYSAVLYAGVESDPADAALILEGGGWHNSISSTDGCASAAS